MPERYVDAIIKYLADRDYQPLKTSQLARSMGVAEGDYGSFREAVKRLRDSGRVVRGARNSLTLPEMSSRVVGTFRANPRGFGFVTPDTPNAHGDLYISESETAGAMSGDTVVARVVKRGKRGGETIYSGRIVEISDRGTRQVAGTLERVEGAWFVVPDGRGAPPPVVISDVGPGARTGQKVVAEITRYPQPGELAQGVIVENLGAAGEIEAETLTVIRAHGLLDEFAPDELDEARRAVESFRAGATDGREDLTGRTVVTIDPADARDFDDAISIDADGDGAVLGVHIADVSHFVPEGGPLDEAARLRGNSVYFPRKVLSMLPEVLSNGVCSLQEGKGRFCKSVFIRYDRDGNVADVRLAETVIRSAQRLTYTEAQSIIDGKTGGFAKAVVKLIRRMNELARLIEARRRRAGMLHLDLPELELVLDDAGRVVDVEAGDDAYTHTIIEMFMVEANVAVASLLNRKDVAFVRRIHPAPDQTAGRQLASFVRVCGHTLPRDISREHIQQLLEAVKGRPESYAVNLAVLKSFQQAEYSPLTVGHFALAADHYCHFTSPIRRYADLTVHRLVRDVVRGRKVSQADPSALTRLGDHCSNTERSAEAAEAELRAVLVLQLLAGKVGEECDGVVTGVTNFGAFVRLRRYGMEGLIRMEDLGDDWWEVSPRTGEIRGQRSGRRFRIGDPLSVRIASVNLPARQLNLVPARGEGKPKAEAKPRSRGEGKPKPKAKPRSRGAGKPKPKPKAKPRSRGAGKPKPKAEAKPKSRGAGKPPRKRASGKKRRGRK